MPCPMGTYGVIAGKCEKCPAGTYSDVVGATSPSVCKKCPDYHWSDAGSSSCGKIKIHLWYAYWSNDNAMDRNCSRATSKWFYADAVVNCNNATFGDPAYGKGKGCGGPCAHIASEGASFPLTCKSLPCVISAGSDRQIRLTADRKMQCFGASWGITSGWSDCGNGNEVVDWH